MNQLDSNINANALSGAQPPTAYAAKQLGSAQAPPVATTRNPTETAAQSQIAAPQVVRPGQTGFPGGAQYQHIQQHQQHQQQQHPQQGYAPNVMYQVPMQPMQGQGGGVHQQHMMQPLPYPYQATPGMYTPQMMYAQQGGQQMQMFVQPPPMYPGPGGSMHQAPNIVYMNTPPGDTPPRIPTPTTPKTPMQKRSSFCRDVEKGTCTRGDNCRYEHPPSGCRAIPTDVCRDFERGKCNREHCFLWHGSVESLVSLRNSGANFYRFGSTDDAHKMQNELPHPQHQVLMGSKGTPTTVFSVTIPEELDSPPSSQEGEDAAAINTAWTVTA